MLVVNFIMILLLLTTINASYRQRDGENDPICDCGSSKHQRRIIGGKPVISHGFPWVVALGLKNGRKYVLRCGGTIVSGRYVLTAAHCAENLSFLFGMIRFTLVVDVGDYDLSTTAEAKSRIVGIETMIKHHNFTKRFLNDDIALLKLVESVSFSDRVRPICLPSAPVRLDQREVTVVGWGQVDREGRFSSVLQGITVPTISHSECQKLFRGRRIRILSTVLCAGVLDGSKDACQGDSGGPATSRCDGQNCLVGIVSFGIKCATKNFPGVYTDVSRYIRWIRSHTGDFPGCYGKCDC